MVQARLGGQFRVGVHFVSNIINAQSQEYYESIVEGRNQFTFSTTRAM